MGGVHTSSIGVRGARRGAACCGARSDDLSARFASSLVQTEHADSEFCARSPLRHRGRPNWRSRSGKWWCFRSEVQPSNGSMSTTA